MAFMIQEVSQAILFQEKCFRKCRVDFLGNENDILKFNLKPVRKHDSGTTR